MLSMIIRKTGLGGGARSRTPGSEDGELPSWTADTACSTAWALWVKRITMDQHQILYISQLVDVWCTNTSMCIPGSEPSLFSVPYGWSTG